MGRSQGLADGKLICQKIKAFLWAKIIRAQGIKLQEIVRISTSSSDITVICNSYAEF